MRELWWRALGCGLINPHPKPDCRELDEGQEVLGQLLVARRDPPAVLDAVEESLDAVALAIEEGTEADRVSPRSARRDVGPAAVRASEGADAVGVIRLIGEKHPVAEEAAQQVERFDAVVLLAGAQSEAKRQALAIDDRVDLRREAATRSTSTRGGISLDTCAVLVEADDRAVDHLDTGATPVRQRIEQLVPDAGASPSDEAVVAGRVGAEAFRKVAPWCSGLQDPENAVDDPAIVNARDAARLVRQKGADRCPFGV